MKQEPGGDEASPGKELQGVGNSSKPETERKQRLRRDRCVEPGFQRRYLMHRNGALPYR